LVKESNSDEEDLSLTGLREKKKFWSKSQIQMKRTCLSLA